MQSTGPASGAPRSGSPRSISPASASPASGAAASLTAPSPRPASFIAASGLGAPSSSPQPASIAPSASPSAPSAIQSLVVFVVVAFVVAMVGPRGGRLPAPAMPCPEPRENGRKRTHRADARSVGIRRPTPRGPGHVGARGRSPDSRISPSEAPSQQRALPVDRAPRVPGYSGGGRAGVPPASLERAWRHRLPAPPVVRVTVRPLVGSVLERLVGCPRALRRAGSET